MSYLASLGLICFIYKKAVYLKKKKKKRQFIMLPTLRVIGDKVGQCL